ncbi:porin [Caballeronia cordobensis]|nr:porin [Burkholderia sp. RPE67]
MKKWVLAAGVSAMATGAAQAQSSVTLFGLIDEGFNYTNNVGGHPLYAMSSGDVQGSRWGLRGSEDLGGGLAAIFKLESGFNVNNGRLASRAASSDGRLMSACRALSTARLRSGVNTIR